MGNENYPFEGWEDGFLNHPYLRRPPTLTGAPPPEEKKLLPKPAAETDSEQKRKNTIWKEVQRSARGG